MITPMGRLIGPMDDRLVPRVRPLPTPRPPATQVSVTTVTNAIGKPGAENRTQGLKGDGETDRLRPEPQTTMPTNPQGERRREEIAYALWRVLAREGPGRASMRAIAREAGYTTGVIFHYFRDKRELMEYGSTLLIDRSIDRIATAAQEDPLAALAELLPLDERRRDEAQLWMTILGWSNSDPDLAEELARRHQQVRHHLRPVISRLRTDVDPDGDRICDLTDQILAVVDGLTVDTLISPESYPPDKQLAILGAAVTALCSRD